MDGNQLHIAFFNQPKKTSFSAKTEPDWSFGSVLKVFKFIFNYTSGIVGLIVNDQQDNKVKVALKILTLIVIYYFCLHCYINMTQMNL